MQPSGRLHIGNYIGAIKQWIAMQDEYEALFCVVDLHAITVPQDPKDLQRKTFEAAKTYLALGIDPERSHIFVQSHVKEHTELAWILNTIAKMGELEKMTQYKEKSSKNIIKSKISGKVIETRGMMEDEKLTLRESIPVGLFDYPVLMASDILLYDTDTVPVGDDQTQHLELTRTLATRFNKRFGDTFRVPKTRILEEGARIMGLDDPTKKMSKSASSEYNYIALDDEIETAKKKIMKAVTDSGSDITYEDDRPGLKNLITIYAQLEGVHPNEIVGRYTGKGYADFKRDLAEVVADFLSEFQESYESIPDDHVRDVLEVGRKYASALAKEKMKHVRDMVGLLG